MNCLRQGLGWLVSFAAAIVLISSAAAQDATNLATGAVSPPLPPTVVLLPPSPVTYFRKLLAMSPEQLQDTMAKKTPEVRQRILAKVTEYEALDPDEREL